MKKIKREVDIQIRFADVDKLGHVNNVNQQHYFDLGKSEFYLEVLNIKSDWSKEGILTANTNTSYFAQILPDDKIYVETSVEAIGDKSITIFQRLISRLSGEVKAESRSVMVAFDFEQQLSITVPQEWREIIER